MTRRSLLARSSTLAWLPAAAIAGGLLAAACGSDSRTDANSDLADRFGVPPGSDVASTEEYEYCAADSCPFGSDGRALLVTFERVEPTLTRDGIEGHVRAAFDDWEIATECGAASGLCGDEVDIVIARSGSSVVSVNMLNWDAGNFEVHFDATGSD